MSQDESRKESAATSLSRIETWRRIRAIIADPTMTEREKLEACRAAGDNHCALTGDDSIVPPQVRAEREKMIEKIEPAIAAATYNRKHRTDLYDGPLF